MVYCPVTILGGLPVIAEVNFSGSGEDFETEIPKLFWKQKNGKKGLRISQKLYHRACDYDDLDNTCEQANDWVCQNVQHLDHAHDERCWRSDEYKLLNP